MSTRETTLNRAALSYAARGWLVFPLHGVVAGKCTCTNSDCGSNGGKHPRTKNGLKDATTNEEQIRQWWAEWPDANIGVRTGPESGILTIDLDIKHDDGPGHWIELLDLYGPVDTLTAITGGGGQHWVFQYPLGTHIPNNTGTLAKGIDVRGDGGYIVVWPSFHLSGQMYEWDNTSQPTLTPKWLVELCSKRPTPKTQTSDYDPWVTKALSEGASDGERNQTAIRLAGYFTSRKIPRDVIMGILEPFAEKCETPFGIPELIQVVDSSQRYQIQIADAKVEKPPEIEERAGILFYSWPEIGLTAEVDQLHRNRQGVHCELTLHANSTEPPRIVHGPVNYNMVSTTGRSALIKYLQERWELDWMQVLEDLSRLGVAYLRSGSPLLDLRDYSKRTANQWALYPFMLENQPTIIFGEGGLGKSLIGLAVMLSLDHDFPLLPGTTTNPGHHGLYIDFEDQPEEQGIRARQLVASAIANDDIPHHYIKCEGPLHEQAPNIKRHMVEKGVTFAILDSAGYACGGEGPEKAESAINYFRALRSLNVPSITIAHNTKDQKRHLPFGSVFWHNSARATWELMKQDSVGDNQIQLGLFNRKANSSKLSKPWAFELVFHPDESIEINNADIQKMPDLAKTTSAVEQLIGFLREGAMTVQELAAETGIKDNTVRVTLTRHPQIFAKAGTNLGAAKWGLQPQNLASE